MNTTAAIQTFPKGATEDISENFRTNLLRILKDRKIPAASISRKAGLNGRAVKDIEERRAVSPRIVTVFKLAEALDVTPQTLLGLEKCHCASDGMSAVMRLIVSMSADQRELLIAAIRHQADSMQKTAAASSLLQSSK